MVYPQKIEASIAAAARATGLRIHGIECKGERDLDRFFAELRGASADAVVVPPLGWVRQPALARMATEFLKTRMPAVGTVTAFTTAGGLLAFGPKYSATRGVGQVDQILRGANPADMPVELPTEFELAINLKTAKGLGLTIPQSVLLRADTVIQ